jgi:hypothetical protein
VTRFWKRRERPLDLEAELRQSRPEPRAEFVRLLAARIDRSARIGTGRIRLAFAVGLSLLLFAALAGFGGIDAAADRGKKFGNSIATVLGGNGPGNHPFNGRDRDDDDDGGGQPARDDDDDDPDDDQYDDDDDEADDD